MTKLKSFLQYWGPAFLMMAIIFGFSSIPSAEMPYFGWVDFLVKKGGHAFGYGLLGLAYLRGLKSGNNMTPPRLYLLAWLLATIYSATDEFHQSFTPGRHPAPTDVMIDSVGTFVGLLMARKYYKKDQPNELVLTRK